MPETQIGKTDGNALHLINTDLSEVQLRQSSLSDVKAYLPWSALITPKEITVLAI